MCRRILGLIIIVATVAMLVALGVFAYYFGPALDQVRETLDNSLSLTVDTLETVAATLEQTQSTLVSMNNSLDTAAQTTANLSTTMADTIPLVEQVSSVVSEQLPENIEAMQNAIPNIAEVAGVVDLALTRLSDFEISQTIPIPFNPIEIQWDLGVDYNPEEPFDESIEALGASLEGLPEELRALQDQLEVSAVNLEVLSQDLAAASGDVEALNAELGKFIPLLDQYLALIDQAVSGIDRIRAQVASNLDTIRLVGTVLPIILALTQLAPLVVGWDLLTARNELEVIVKDGVDQPEFKEELEQVEEMNEQEEEPPLEEAEDTLVQYHDGEEKDEEDLDI